MHILLLPFLCFHEIPVCVKTNVSVVLCVFEFFGFCFFFSVGLFYLITIFLFLFHLISCIIIALMPFCFLKRGRKMLMYMEIKRTERSWERQNTNKNIFYFKKIFSIKKNKKTCILQGFFLLFLRKTTESQLLLFLQMKGKDESCTQSV